MAYSILCRRGKMARKTARPAKATNGNKPTSAQPAEAEEPALSLEDVRPITAPRFYVMGLSVQGLNNEVTLVFNRPLPLQEAKTGALRQDIAMQEIVVAITMSPQSFKDMVVVCGDVLSK